MASEQRPEDAAGRAPRRSAAAREIHVGSFNPSIHLDLARASGALERGRLVVHESLVPSSPAQFGSLEKGEYDAVFTSPDNVLAYHFLSENPLRRRIRTRIVAGIDRGMGLSLMTRPNRATAGALREATLGVDVEWSGFAFVAYALLERIGVAPGSYAVEALGSTSRRADALIGGRCDVTVLNAGNELRARAAGCSTLGAVTEIGPYLGTVLATRLETNADARDGVARLVDVVRRVTESILSGELRAEVCESASRLLGLSAAQARDYERGLRDPDVGLVHDLGVDRASIESLLTLRSRYRPTEELDEIVGRLDEVLDPRILR